VNAFGGTNPAVLGHSAQELTVNSSSVVDGSLVAADTDTTSIQSRVTGTCGAGSSISSVNSAGAVGCETDDLGGGTGSKCTNTTIAQGTGTVGFTAPTGCSFGHCRVYVEAYSIGTATAMFDFYTGNNQIFLASGIERDTVSTRALNRGGTTGPSAITLLNAGGGEFFEIYYSSGTSWSINRSITIFSASTITICTD